MQSVLRDANDIFEDVAVTPKFNIRDVQEIRTAKSANNDDKSTQANMKNVTRIIPKNEMREAEKEMFKELQDEYDKENYIQPANNRLIKASEATKSLTAQEWAIKSILPSEGLLEIIGASGSYKSFITLDMLFCISSGIEYHGHKTQKGTVVYIAGEGINGAKIRLRGLELHYCIEDYDFYILPMPSNLMDKNEMQTLAKEISEISSDVSVVVFDTLHRNSAGAGENSADDWATILSNIDRLLKPVSKVVGWVHHTGVSETATDRGRGTSSRYASVETQILIKKSKEKKATMTNTKQKDAEEFGSVFFEFEDIETGLTDEDGEQVTTLYPQITEAGESEKKRSKLTKEHYDLVASLRLSIDSKGMPINEEIKERDSIVSGQMILVSEWQTDALKVLTSNGDSDEKKQNEAKAKKFNRHKKVLINANEIAEYDNFVYIVHDCVFKFHHSD